MTAKHIITIVMCALALGPVTSSAPAIVGGHAANLDAWPYMAALYIDDADIFQSQFCGGVLVAPDKVITAAHCLWNEDTGQLAPAGSVKVLTGTTDLTSGAGAAASIVAAVRPPVVIAPTVPDIAVATLDRPLPAPTILVSGDSRWALRPGASVWAAGWGRSTTSVTGKYPEFPERLQEAQLVSFSNPMCNLLVSPTGFDVCVGDFDTAAGQTCFGDSGGPLTGWGADGREYLLGLSSRVFNTGKDRCSQPFHPSVYTRTDQPGIAAWLASQGVPLVTDTGSGPVGGAPPRVRIASGRARVGSPLVVEYSTYASTPKRAVEVLVTGGAESLGLWFSRWTQSRDTRLRVMDVLPRWTKGKVLRACVRAVDENGNASPRRCARIRVA